MYSLAQKEAWVPIPPDYKKWKARLVSKQPYLAVINDKIAGFIELEEDGHIDCTYTLPEYQGKGVANTLLNHITEIARKKSYKRLYVDTSIVAKPFFEKCGFNVLHENNITRNKLLLTNFTMEKWL